MAITLVCFLIISYSAFRVLDTLYPLDFSRYKQLSTVVTDRNGEWLHIYLNTDDKYRLPVRGALPADYLNLLIHYEDRDFYHHHGVDFSAVVRATWQNASSGRVVSGASTLSMQTARLLMPQPRSFRGKIVQTFRAWQLERRLDKAKILAIYATLAPAGGNREGLTSASHYYLNKPLDKLSLGESAWLVALTQSPEKLSRNTDAALRARDKVLKRAFDFDAIDATRYQQALAEPLALAHHDFLNLAPHVSGYKRRTLPNQQQVQTTLDKSLQVGLQQVLRKQLPQQHQNANLAGAILDNASGEWLAYVGSAEFFSKARLGQVDMLSAVRSPGSTMKPFITLYAFDWLNFKPQTTIDDTPIVAVYQPSNYDGRFQGRITLAKALSRSRNVPAVRLLRHIKPDYFSNALEKQGLKMYLPKGARPNLSLALGGMGIRGNALARLYRRLANCSFQSKAKNTSTDNSSFNNNLSNNTANNTLDNNVSKKAPFTEGAFLEGTTSKTVKKGALAKHRACQQVTQILRQSQDVQGRVFFGREPVAFKTGTAYGWRDRWVFAYTKSYTIMLWNGRADGQFAEQRASAEALIPVLRQVVGLLPNPPTSKNNLGARDWITNHALPSRLRHVNSEANNTTRSNKARNASSQTRKPNQNTLAITAPLDHSVIDFRADMRLSFHLQGGTPPYFYLLNDELIAQIPDTAFHQLNASAGSYHLLVIDADGNSSESQFRLVNQEMQPKQIKARKASWTSTTD